MDKVFGKHGPGKTNTHIGHLIDAATDGATNSSENWAKFMDICDAINVAEEGPKDASKAIRRRFQTKNAATITNTLVLLETCVKNCGRRFHLQIATKDFLQDLVKVIGPKNNPSLETQNTVLGLIQTWAYAFTKDPELKEVNKTYQELKTKGVEFPPLEPEKASAANIPSKSAPTVVATPVRPSRTAHGNQASSGARSGAGGGVKEMTAERVAKLHIELQTVQQNCRVFGDLLTDASSNSSTADLELLEDLNRTCRQMQVRIQELLVKIQNEQITGELLTVNDELNNVFLRYDRFERMRAGREGGQESHSTQIPHAGATAHQGAIYDNAGSPVGPSVANLIDIDDVSAQQTNTGAASNFSANFAHLQLGSRPVTSQDEFDGAYDNQVPLNDKESDFLEMQKWLLENPSTAGGSVASNNAADQDFDKFLSQRQKEAERLPSVNQSGSAAGSRAESNNEPLFSL